MEKVVRGRRRQRGRRRGLGTGRSEFAEARKGGGGGGITEGTCITERCLFCALVLFACGAPAAGGPVPVRRAGTARLTQMARNRDGPGAATAPAPEIQRQATAAVKLELRLASTPGARACYRVIRFRLSRTACWR